jgi:ATP-dependent helicase YprA (DUF1998 family)
MPVPASLSLSTVDVLVAPSTNDVLIEAAARRMSPDRPVRLQEHHISALRAAFEGKSVLAVWPTGSGKTLLLQLLGHGVAIQRERAAADHRVDAQRSIPRPTTLLVISPTVALRSSIAAQLRAAGESPLVREPTLATPLAAAARQAVGSSAAAGRI